MKKLYFLFLTFIGIATYGQNLVVNGSFENWTAGAPDGYTTVDFSTTDLTENTNAAYVSEGTKSASVNVLTQSQGNTDIKQTVALTGGVTYTMSLDVYATNNEARARIFNGDNYNPSQYSDPDILNTWQTISFEYTPDSNEDFDFGIRFYDISGNWVSGSLFYIDNFSITATAVNPNIAITAPADGSTIPTTDVDVELNVANFNVAASGGDGYIQYSVDGGTTTDKFDTTAISLTGLAEGSHTVNVELVDNSGQPLATPATATTTFTVSTISQVATISDLRAGTLNSFYQLTGEAVISYIVTDNTRNQKYIQDATGGILIDDNAGVLSTAFSIGDGLTGLQGELTEYAGVLQFIPSANLASASSSSNVITPQEITAAEFTANAEDYESELIKITNVTFQDTGVFEDNTSYDAVNGGSTVVARVTFGDENLIGATIPTTTSYIIGLGSQFYTDYQIFPRYVTDVEGATLSVDKFNSTSFSVYPNPVSNGVLHISSQSNEAISVAVYDVLGKQVLAKTISNNTLNVAGLNAGLYIVKITQNGQAITKKVVIK
ncbi:T9SS type A sorting domain-containing protein [Bizionia sp. KMM 8389]